MPFGETKKTTFIMSFLKGEVVLLPFPFSDLSGSKVRPAVIAGSPVSGSPDVFIVPITSRPDLRFSGEFQLLSWAEAGLNTSSFVKRGCFLIDSTLIVKRIGRIGAEDRVSLDFALRTWLDL